MNQISLAVAALGLGAFAQLRAQEASPSEAAASIVSSANRLGTVNTNAAPLARAFRPFIQADSANRRHLWKYLLGGVVIGGAIGGGAGLIAIRDCAKSDSCMLAGPAVAVAGTVGALLGALVGLLGYADPYPNQGAH